MLQEQIGKYLKSNVTNPYFLVVGDNQYQSVRDFVDISGMKTIRISDYCHADDRLPDIDNFVSFLESGVVGTEIKNIAVVGLGEYLALMGSKRTKLTLMDLKDKFLNNKKVIFILRAIASEVRKLETDPRFDDRRCFFLEPTDHNLSLIKLSSSLDLPIINGIKALLQELETGKKSEIIVNTLIDLSSSTYSVKDINGSYDVLRYLVPKIGIPSNCGDEEMWSQLLRDVSNNNNSVVEVLKNYDFENDLESDFYKKLSGTSYKNWLYFISLKIHLSSLKCKYLKYVIDITTDFKDFKYNFINGIIEVSHKNVNFKRYYNERKELIEKFPEADIANFAVNNRKDIKESIYKLTDNTTTEREEIVAWVSKHGMIQEINDIYPALAHYMNKYQFVCGNLSDRLTDYFEKYKHLKINNTIDNEFLQEVDDLAEKRIYNRLSSREEIISNLDTDNKLLLWVDALGVEYLAYITYLANKLDLSLQISIGRSMLPTITSINRTFYDEWSGEKKKINQLDEIKHKSDGGYNFEGNDLPIHLAKELKVIENIMNEIANKLASKKYKNISIVSDHGASRLAVIRRKEEKHETDTRGEHSGRCCKAFKNYDLSFATEENGYIVLADYGRFKGSRAANVEVHGGASLEEVVVPIIQLTLKNTVINIKLMEDKAIADYKAGTSIKFFSDTPLEKVTVHTSVGKYSVKKIDDNHYEVQIADIKKAGQYPIEIYSGDNLIKKISVDVQSKIGSMNTDFDDVF